MRQRGDITWHLELPCTLLYSQNAPPRPSGSSTTYTRRASVAAHAPIGTLSLSNKTQPSRTNNASSLLYILLSFCFLLCDLAPVCTNRGFVDQSSPSFELFISSPAVERFVHYYCFNYFAHYYILIVVPLFLFLARFLRVILWSLSGIVPIPYFVLQWLSQLIIYPATNNPKSLRWIEDQRGFLIL